MGAGVSNWRLAQSVSKLGQLGVVSGTALEVILARRLQDGDPGGHMRRALAQFPFPEISDRILKAYYLAGGKEPSTPYKATSMYSQRSPRDLVELCVAANFVEVFLASEGHDNPVGINYLEKVQLPHLPSIYGAMLAGVGYVLMGAGIPLKIPGVLDAFVNHEPATYPLYVNGAIQSEETQLRFDPREFFEISGEIPPLRRPNFLAIIASNTLATTLIKKSNGKVDGFVIEGPTAGGHNAPPRGKLQLSDLGEPIYGERDDVDLEKIRSLGLPFWLAGGFGTSEKIREALAAGAAGVQVGTAFAFCEESGLREDYKRTLLEDVRNGTALVFTDPVSSPTGFPFKAAMVSGSNSECEIYEQRPRVCDVGHLREAYQADGKISFRCSAEPVANFTAKGGSETDTIGKKCLCNALLANIGHSQLRKNDYIEQGLVTTGNDLTGISRYMVPGATTYTAEDVIQLLMEPEKTTRLEAVSTV